MKSSLFILAFVFTSFYSHAQFTIDVNGIYFERATKKFNANDLKQADIYFERAVRYDSKIDDSAIARMGSILYFELKNVKLAKTYAKRYFELENNKTSKEYEEMLALNEDIDILKKKKELEKELMQIKSLVFVKSI